MDKTDSDELEIMRAAVEAAREGVQRNLGGPFGAIVVRDETIIGQGCNEVIAASDPTAHAEIVAIRDASRRLGVFHLPDCVLYSTCEPCPMCLAACYWARIDRIVYAATKEDAAEAGFSDGWIYEEFARPADGRAIRTRQIAREDALALFDFWRQKTDKPEY